MTVIEAGSFHMKNIFFFFIKNFKFFEYILRAYLSIFVTKHQLKVFFGTFHVTLIFTPAVIQIGCQSNSILLISIVQKSSFIPTLPFEFLLIGIVSCTFCTAAINPHASSNSCKMCYAWPSASRRAQLRASIYDTGFIA